MTKHKTKTTEKLPVHEAASQLHEDLFDSRQVFVQHSLVIEARSVLLWRIDRRTANKAKASYE
jgi:hypothetical protein